MQLRTKLQASKSYAVFYGNGRAVELSGYNVVIVEPLGQPLENLTFLKAQKTLVLAYLSVMEINSEQEAFKLLQMKDVLEYQGKPLINHEYGNYLMDLTSARWQNIVIYKALKLCKESGYDGVFLDTIGDVESALLPPGIKTNQIIAAAQLVRKMREVLPGKLLVQNNGIEKLSRYTAPYLDGICWENPLSLLQNNKEFGLSILEYLSVLQEEQGLTIFLLVEDEQNNKETLFSQMHKEAAKRKFLVYKAPASYLSI